MVKIPAQSICNSIDNKPEIFNVLSEEEYELIIKNKIIVKYKPGETIIKENSRATQALIIIDGFTQVITSGDYQKELIIRYLKRNDFFGISGLYNDRIYFFTIKAVEECTACFIDYDILEQLIKNNNAFSAGIIKLLSNEKVHIHMKFLCLTQKQSPGKVANAILYLHNEIFQNSNMTITASRNDIANLTGMANDNAGRILKDLTKNKLIKYDGKTITILKPDQLEKIKDIG